MWGLPGCLRLTAMSRILFVTLTVLISIPMLLFVTAWLYPRPVDTTPPWVFESDGSELDYCELPELDGSGLMASDIPRAYTPGCGYTQYPQPILRDCTEPLPENAQDLRGLWQSVSPALPDHVERVEQCGDRVVITTAGGHTLPYIDQRLFRCRARGYRPMDVLHALVACDHRLGRQPAAFQAFWRAYRGETLYRKRGVQVDVSQ